jgi:hypothetical protein
MPWMILNEYCGDDMHGRNNENGEGQLVTIKAEYLRIAEKPVTDGTLKRKKLEIVKNRITNSA